MKILNIVGARPNFMKIAPLHRAFNKNPQTVHQKMLEILQGTAKKGVIPPFWDGHAAERIAGDIV